MIKFWHNVESSNVKSIAYDEDTHEIIVVFHNDSVYAYDPGRTIYDSFLAAPSKGKFVHDVLREGKFIVRKLSA